MIALLIPCPAASCQPKWEVVTSYPTLDVIAMAAILILSWVIVASIFVGLGLFAEHLAKQRRAADAKNQG